MLLWKVILDLLIRKRMDVVVIPGNRLVVGLMIMARWLVLYDIVTPLHLASVDPPCCAPCNPS